VRLSIGESYSKSFLGANITLRGTLRFAPAGADFGAGFGPADALVLMRLISPLLFDVNPTDPLTYVVVTTGWLATAALASYMPSRRTATVDPVDARGTE